MKAVFEIDGTLPTTWEDFYSKTDGVPSITIFCSGEEGEEDQQLDFKFIKIPESILTEAIAIATIKKHLHLAGEVKIIQNGVVQAI